MTTHPTRNVYRRAESGREWRDLSNTAAAMTQLAPRENRMNGNMHEMNVCVASYIIKLMLAQKGGVILFKERGLCVSK